MKQESVKGQIKPQSTFENIVSKILKKSSLSLPYYIALSVRALDDKRLRRSLKGAIFEYLLKCLDKSQAKITSITCA